MTAYLRKCKLPISDVVKSLTSGHTLHSFKGGSVKITSNRIKTYTKSTSCVNCGMEASFFAVEKHRNDKNGEYHLNPYFINDDGEEVMMTSDHIVPKARGGGDEMSNRQPMCQPCNQTKADFVSFDEAIKSKRTQMNPPKKTKSFEEELKILINKMKNDIKTIGYISTQKGDQRKLAKINEAATFRINKRYRHIVTQNIMSECELARAILS